MITAEKGPKLKSGLSLEIFTGITDNYLLSTYYVLGS